jgi:hypothetical protein
MIYELTLGRDGFPTDMVGYFSSPPGWKLNFMASLVFRKQCLFISCSTSGILFRTIQEL